MTPRADIVHLVHEMKQRGENFAVATVVRTVSVTAAKPGAKAIINAQGDVVEGWIGGGCARSAVVKSAISCMQDGQARLVSLRPQELLEEQSVGTEADHGKQSGVVMAQNMCPSKGSMEIFVEPMLANPSLLIMGASPVAIMLASMAGTFDMNVTTFASSDADAVALAEYNPVRDITELPVDHPHRYTVVSTQGSGDLQALMLAQTLQARHVSFVGSARKTDHLRSSLLAKGADKEFVHNIKGPAGIDIGGVTPQEIALSILAEIVRFRRSENSRINTSARSR